MGSGSDILRVTLTAVALYFLLVIILRVSGKRTLSSMNAFDFIVTVAIGTTLSQTILDRTVTLSEGLTAFIVLIGLQFLISWSSSKSKKISRLIKSEPKLLSYRGEFLHDALKKERIVELEVIQALRSKGYSSLNDVDAVVLETNGNISIIDKVKQGDADSTLRDINF